MRCLVSVYVDVAPEVAWRYVADFANDPRWREGVLAMRQSHAGVVREGASIREKWRSYGLTLRTTSIISRVGPGRRLAFRSLTGRIPLQGWRTVETARGETIVTLGLQARLPWPLAPLDPLASRLYRRRVAADAARLALILQEAGQREAVPAG